MGDFLGRPCGTGQAKSPLVFASQLSAHVTFDMSAVVGQVFSAD